MISRSLFWAPVLAGALLFPLARPACAQDVEAFTIDSNSALVYHVSHPLHHVEGTSHALAGVIKLAQGKDPELVVPLTFTVPVQSFNSGNRNRDHNMDETLDAADYPDITLTIRKVNWQRNVSDASGESLSGVADGSLLLHGISHPVSIPISGTIDKGTLTAKAHFDVSCTAYQIPRPALLFMPIDDKVGIDVTLDATAH